MHKIVSMIVKTDSPEDAISKAHDVFVYLVHKFGGEIIGRNRSNY